MELRIKEIRSKGLFGMFDHVIPLKLDSHITIIYGENGIGKTMIFRMLNSLFEMDFSTLGTLPFQVLELDFEGGAWIKVRRAKQLHVSSSSFAEEVAIEIVSPKVDSVETIIKIFSSRRKKTEEGQIRERFKDQIIKSPELFSRLKLHEVHNDLIEGAPLGYLIDRYPHEIREIISIDIDYWTKIFGGVKPECPKKLADVLGALKCYLIGTSRLLMTAESLEIPLYDLPPRYQSSISYYSDEMAKSIRSRHELYQKQSDELELSLRKRLSSGQLSQTFSIEELERLAEEVSNRRRELKEVGLWDEVEQEGIGPLESLNEVSRAILGVNLSDAKTKLAVFDEMYDRLRLFLDIINERRFSYKRLSIHPKRGFVFINANGENLSLTDLSSGEQHELVLLYQLLFKVPKNALILIDEPEISLHLVWQKAFIQDMTEIIGLRHFDLIAATHSPSIVNGQWDEYTVRLKGKELVHG